MRIRTLGCYGSEYPGYSTVSLLINGCVALDAGSLTSSLRLAEQADIKHIVLSHSHLDHLLDIGFLADNIIGRIAQPVEILGTSYVLGNLMKHIMNNRIWPDFTKIPTAAAPVLKIRKIKQRVPFEVAGLKFRAIPVTHSVPCWGFIVHEPGGGSIVYSGDTRPTKEIWNAAKQTHDLKAVFVEVSFPNSMQELADRSGHMTPKTMLGELKKLGMLDRVRVYLHHMKPLYLKEIQRDVKALRMKNVALLEAGKKIVI